MQNNDLINQVTECIKKDILNENEAQDINNDTPLISGGLIDSITVLKLVDLLEKRFSIEFEAHEVDRDYLDSINKIVDFISKKISK